MNLRNSLLVALALLVAVPAVAEENDFSFNCKIDLVSDYVWRGSNQGSDLAVQPTLGFAWRGLSLTAWGSQSLTKANGAQEFDLTLGYAWRGLAVSVTDYWWSGVSSRYGDYRRGHHIEAAIAYTIPIKTPVTIAWATMVAGGDNNTDGKRAYSTYISAQCDIPLFERFVLTPSVGFTPWKGMYNAQRGGLTDASIKLTCNAIKGKKWSAPLFVQVIYAPHDQLYGVDKTYLVGGVSLAF